MTVAADNIIHGRALQALAVAALLACVLLDLYTVGVVARAASFGGRLRSVVGEVIATGLDPGGPLVRAGVREGDVLLRFAGRRAPPEAFVNEPDEARSWTAYDQIFSFNAFMAARIARGPVELVFRRGEEQVRVELRPQPAGWLTAVLHDLPLRLVGWCFLVVAFLIWRKQQSETTLINYIGGLGVFAALITLSSIGARDVALPPADFLRLTHLNYWSTQSAILTLHLGLVFPAPVAFLSRHKWVRALPWVLVAVQGIARILRAFHNPAWTSSILAPAALAGFAAILVTRTWRCKQPVLRAQLQWVLAGAVAGFLPWVLLSALPMSLGHEPIPARFTLLTAVLAPICVLLAIRRYRLLDVGSVLDWVIIHALLVVGFLIVEVLALSWVSGRLPEVGASPTALVVNSLIVVLLYAPLRTRLMRLLARVTGRAQFPVADAINTLFENTRATGNPMEAVERTLDQTLAPTETLWVQPGHRHDGVIERMEALAGSREAVLGHELGDACPIEWEACAIVGVRARPEPFALVLWPRAGWSWRRSDLALAASLVRSAELLLEIERLQREHSAAQKAMREQREQVLLEMHDGLGSELFGLSLLTRVPEEAELGTYRTRMHDISSAVHEAMDSLRTGLTVLSSPPGAFAPSMLSLLMRAERTFAAAGIEIEMQIDDDVSDVQLPSRGIFGLLRAVQEALTNIARHARCSRATVRITRSGEVLRISVEDDGIGFQPGEAVTGHGLVNLQRRLESLGGRFVLSSAPGQGTRIQLELGL